MKEGQNLLSDIISGLEIFYTSASQSLIYPVFTALFVLSCAITVALGVLAFKNYLKYNFSLAVKLTTVTLVALIATVDIYLVAFGKTALFILYLKFQKDLFFIILACIVGLVCGRILFKGRGEGKILP